MVFRMENPAGKEEGWMEGRRHTFVCLGLILERQLLPHIPDIFGAFFGRQVKRRHTPEPCQNMLLKVSGLEKACLEDAQLPSDFQRPPSASLDSLALSVDLRAFGVGKGVRACETRTEFRVPAPFFSTFSIFVPLGTGSIH